MKPKPLQEVPLDVLLTVEQFAAWVQSPVSTVRKRLFMTPGVIRESRKSIRIHPRTYLEAKLGKAIK
jgi:hypothetical protein